jgi:hypothetical protein
VKSVYTYLREARTESQPVRVMKLSEVDEVEGSLQVRLTYPLDSSATTRPGERDRPRPRPL